MAIMHDAAERKSEPSIQDALNTWHAAQSFYENVSDPDLIDFAIYDMEAARRRYMYMLKMARTGGKKAGPR